jgi:glyceraldehyde-3-phosphate dehydrogenase (ferredoxin)
VIYGGTFVDEDFRDRKVADDWFQEKYNKKLAVKDFEATTKYRFDPEVRDRRHAGRQLRDARRRLMFFNYRSIYASEEQRLQVHEHSSSITT